MSTVRKATQGELEGMMYAFANYYAVPCYKDEVNWPSHAYIVEGYTSDGPGYAGIVGIVLWGEGPEMVTTFKRYDYDRVWMVAGDTTSVEA